MSRIQYISFKKKRKEKKKESNIYGGSSVAAKSNIKGML
jgi:hypothetical protein